MTDRMDDLQGVFVPLAPRLHDWDELRKWADKVANPLDCVPYDGQEQTLARIILTLMERVETLQADYDHVVAAQDRLYRVVQDQHRVNGELTVKLDELDARKEGNA